MQKQKKIIVDTGYIVALFNENDAKHQLVMDTEQKLGDEFQFVTTIFVIHEVCWLLKKTEFMMFFLTSVKEGTFIVENLPANWIEQIISHIQKYSNRNLDIADASLVVLADLLNIGDILTIDEKDFTILRWGNGKKTFNLICQNSNF